jgi:nitrogen fixation/metabolism regulation signal transduction histidine kinase
MRFYNFILVLLAVSIFAACANTPKLVTPLDTLQTYTRAIKKNDVEMMKRLLSDASLKMAEQEAASQNVPLDDVIKRETLFNEMQTSLKYRNEKIEDDKATIEVENSFGSWDTVFFVKEDGVWKIDKQGAANQMMQQMDQQNKQLDSIINQP